MRSKKEMEVVAKKHKDFSMDLVAGSITKFADRRSWCDARLWRVRRPVRYVGGQRETTSTHTARSLGFRKGQLSPSI
jgi:hypothetical protein